MSEFRRQFLFELDDIRSLKGLEIGPLNSPLVKREEIKDGGEIFYLDHLPTNELKEKYKDDDSVDISNIVDVDFVCGNGDVIEAVNGSKFDYVVASHVIEHTPNLLKFLTDIYEILEPDGQCLLIIPDKRFTFDHNRPVTTFGVILENFLTGATFPGVSAVYDHFSKAIHANGHNLWYGLEKTEDASLLVSEEYAWDAAQNVNDKALYYDVHVNIFTPYSFLSILKHAIKHQIIFFEVNRFRDTKVGQIEFMVALKRINCEVTEIKTSDLLASIPNLQMESLLSPYMPQVKALSEALERTSNLNQNLLHEITGLRAKSSGDDDKIKNLTEATEAMQRVLQRRSIQLVLSIANKIRFWKSKPTSE